MYSTHNQRLKKLLESEKLNNTTFGHSIGEKPRNIGNYINKKTPFPNGKLVINVLKNYPNWNIRYWLLGQGKPKLEEEDTVFVSQESEPVYIHPVVQELTKQLAFLRQEIKQRDTIIAAYKKSLEAMNGEGE